MILKEYSAVAVVRKLVLIWLTDKQHALKAVLLFFCGYFSEQFDLYIQLNNINLKLKTAAAQDAVPNPAAPQCATYIVYKK